MIRPGDKVAVYECDSMQDRHPEMACRDMEKRWVGTVKCFNFRGNCAYVIADSGALMTWVHRHQMRKLKRADGVSDESE